MLSNNLRKLAPISPLIAGGTIADALLMPSDEPLFAGYTGLPSLTTIPTPDDVVAAIFSSITVDSFAVSQSWISECGSVVITLCECEGVVSLFLLSDQLAYYTMCDDADGESFNRNWIELQRYDLTKPVENDHEEAA